MADVGALADALVATLETLPELAHRVSDTAPDKVITPWAWITIAPEEDGGEYDAVFGNVAWWFFDAVVAVGRSESDRRALRALYAYTSSTGPKSVKLAIESDPTLGGRALAVLVSAPATGNVRSDSMELLAARWRVRVLA